jgi:hypothetical protein
MRVLLLLTVDTSIPGGDCSSDDARQIEKEINRDVRMSNRRRIERMRLAHPLWNESLPTRLGYESIVWRALGILLRTDSSLLAVQRVKGIKDSDISTLLMGSMQDLCSAGRPRCSSTWPATRTGWRSAIIGC